MSTADFDLFSMPVPASAPRRPVVGRIPLRWCQREDVDALVHAIEGGHNKPCCVAATGYGKSIVEAELAGRLLGEGKVLFLVDRANLAFQLAGEIERHLDIKVGTVADGVITGLNLSIIVATVQAMYSPGEDGRPLYEWPQFNDVRTVIVDEGHKFFAPVYQSVPHHFIEDKGAVVILFTATPVAANGAAWESFVNWTAHAEGPCMRTVPWCVRNGLLVPPRQAFVQTTLHLSEIYDRLSGDGDPDGDNENGGDELSQLLLDLLSDKNEQEAARCAMGVAKGLAAVIGRRQALIFAPARVQAAQLIASWLTHLIPCEAVWGARADKSDFLERFLRGRPQAASNVNLLTEGFNHTGISAVCICRFTKVWRIIHQMVGRGLRPARSCIEDLARFDEPDQESQRRAVIANSEKPDAIIADLVGLDGKVLQASAVEALYAAESPDVKREMGRILQARFGQRPEREPVDEHLRDAARAELARKQNDRLAELARKRGMAGALGADVDVRYGENAAADLPEMPAAVSAATEAEQAMFVAFALQYDVARAAEIASRMPRNQLKGMTFSMKKKIEKEGKRPDWARARRAYPQWAQSKGQQR